MKGGHSTSRHKKRSSKDVAGRMTEGHRPNITQQQKEDENQHEINPKSQSTFWLNWIWQSVRQNQERITRSAEEHSDMDQDDKPTPIKECIIHALTMYPDPTIVSEILSIWAQVASDDAEEGEDDQDDEQMKETKALHQLLFNQLPPIPDMLELLQWIDISPSAGSNAMTAATSTTFAHQFQPSACTLFDTVINLRITLMPFAHLATETNSSTPPSGSQKASLLSEDGIRKSFLNRLSIPHATLDETFAAYSSFETMLNHANYTDRMRKASGIVSQTKKYSKKREILESRLQELMDESSLIPIHSLLMLFLEYVTYEKHCASVKKSSNEIYGHPIRALGLYERALLMFPQDVELWSGYLSYMNAHVFPFGQKLMEVAYQRCCHILPGYSFPHIQLMLYRESMETAKLEMKAGSVADAYSVGYGVVVSETERVSLFVAWISYLIRKANSAFAGDTSSQEASIHLEHLRGVCEQCLEFLAPLDPHQKLPLLHVQLHIELYLSRDVERARLLYQKLLKQLPHSTSLLLEYCAWEKVQSLPRSSSSKQISFMRSLFKQAMLRKMDGNLDALGDAYLDFERFFGNLDDFKTAQDKILWMHDRILLHDGEQEKVITVSSTAEGTIVKKRKMDNALVFDEVDQHESSDLNMKAISSSAAMTAEETLPAPKVDFADFKVVENALAGNMLYLSELPYSTTQELLEETFNPFGELEDVILRPDPQGRLEAYIEYRGAEEVKRALTGCASLMLLGEPFRAQRCRPSDTVWDFQKNEEPNKLYVSGLPKTVLKSVLRELFSKFGQVIEIRIVRRTNSFCYVQYRNTEEAQKALVLNETHLPGESGDPINVAISDPRRAAPKTVNEKELFIINLPHSLVKEDIQALFEPYGAIHDIRMLHYQDTGSFRGLCYVEYEDATSARLAREHLNASIVDGRIITVSQSDPNLRKKQLNLERKQDLRQHAKLQATLFVPRATGNKKKPASGRRQAVVIKDMGGSAMHMNETPSSSPDASQKASAKDGEGGKSQADFRKLMGL